MRTDEQLLQLRPDLGLDLSTSKGEERFQNETLRPMLKWQHLLLRTLFEHYIQKRKGVYFALPKASRPAWVADSIRSDQRFRNLLAGTVIGQFTEAELRFFNEHETECMRRLVALTIERLQSETF